MLLERTDIIAVVVCLLRLFVVRRRLGLQIILVLGHFACFDRLSLVQF